MCIFPRTSVGEAETWIHAQLHMRKKEQAFNLFLLPFSLSLFHFLFFFCNLSSLNVSHFFLLNQKKKSDNNNDYNQNHFSGFMYMTFRKRHLTPPPPPPPHRQPPCFASSELTSLEDSRSEPEPPPPWINPNRPTRNTSWRSRKYAYIIYIRISLFFF